jgi:hypothetical protein
VRIQDTTRAAVEIVELGGDVLLTLERQREQMLRSKDTVHDIDADVSRARSTLRSIARRLSTNKCLIAIIVATLVVVVLVVVLWHTGVIPLPAPVSSPAPSPSPASVLAESDPSSTPLPTPSTSSDTTKSVALPLLIARDRHRGGTSIQSALYVWMAAA